MRICFLGIVLFSTLTNCSRSREERPFESGFRVERGLESCAMVAREYVKSRLGWDETTYRIDSEGKSGDGANSFFVIAAEDEKAADAGRLGGGKSFELRIDCSSGKVVGAFAGQ